MNQIIITVGLTIARQMRGHVKGNGQYDPAGISQSTQSLEESRVGRSQQMILTSRRRHISRIPPK